jgi:integrase
LNTTVEKEERRTRVLAPHELALIWNHAEEEGDYPAIVRLLMLLACRASEIGGLQWSEIHGDVIQLAPARTKTNTAFFIPLPQAACDILERLPRREGRDLVFGIGASSVGFNGWHKAKLALDERIAKATGHALPHWTHHDLRRSACSHMNEIGIEPHIVEQILGHKIQGVASRYNHASYQNQKRIALERWADTLMAWVSGKPGSNIVSLQRQA